MTIVQTVDLRKSFGSVQALNGLDLVVRGGQIHGFIGPNGAGKTTTIRILLGMLKPSSGQASLFGRDAWRDAVDIHRRTAYVPGEVSLWPNLTGGEALDLFGRLRGKQDPRRRAELIERFDLDPSKKCGTYSKGNRQKVALIAAFASDAELFILDEPTSGLDPLMEQVFQDYVRELKVQGRSVLLSSHILSEVEKLCDFVSIIREGVIIESGSLEELRHLTSTHVAVQTKRPLSGLEQLPGVEDVVERDGSFIFRGGRVSGIDTHLALSILSSWRAPPP